MRVFSLFTVAFVALLISSTSARSADKFDPAALAAAVAPYLDDQAIGVAHIDPARIDPVAILDKVAELIRPTAEQRTEIKAAAGHAQMLLAAYTKAGGGDVYFVVSLADFPGDPIFAIVTVKEGGDAKAIAALIREGGVGPPAGPRGSGPFEVVEPLGKAVFAGRKKALERLRAFKPSPRPELVTAFEAAGDTAAQAVFVPTADNRRVIRESLPLLPAEIGGGSGAALADGIQWAAVGLNAPPKLSLSVTIQSKDAESAAAVAKVMGAAYKLAAGAEEVRQAVPKLDELIKLITPTIKEDRLTIVLNDENGGVTQLTEALAQPVHVAREAARRTQSMNNLKQLALAFHNYADTYRKFPTAASYSKDGKPLLSWRVQLLPYLDENELYKQFHLDEAWDSEHNRKLIDKMPKTLASPLADIKEPGKTVYLAPVSEGTIFAGKKARTFGDITDGTVNTILFVEVSAEKAVVWTRPDDLNVDLEKPLAGLVAPGAKGFLIALCDGSVRFVSAKVDTRVLKAIFTIAGGEVSDPSKL